ncbi:hypothetical protein Jab_1c03160 [Janthinobacterium sp. HH01]|uniref:hypothetical protein n=1 Tax=Janthinobacterium sp. HH01 TaxID=1198452 RepID=UPI0002AEACB2|nr:hypothetical protein [Janthinobacterium sp. HH01]ELX11730.1 hypothetical protein Jab_1c03160 [Janthinobacterium sp. HH01]
MARIAKQAVVPLVAAKFSELIHIPVGGIVIPENKPTAWQLVRQRGDMLVAPGVSLDLEPGTPVFRADPQDPNLLIRELDGRAERGYFRAGKFVAVP